MNKDKTEIVIVLDRSGSMGLIRSDMEGGLKTFIENQAKDPGECLISLYQFDDKYEKVFELVPVKSVSEINIVPRGYTALRDAIGKTINSVGERLKNTNENDRPGLVTFVVITDGYENASNEFSKAEIKKMVDHQKSKYNWKFIFLGANQDAVLSGADYGYNVGSSVTYATNGVAISNVLRSLSSNISMMKSQTSLGISADVEFTAKDRADAVDGDDGTVASFTTNKSPNVTVK